MAKDVGGRVQPGSGAPEFYKSDVRDPGNVRVECKTTSKGSYSLKLTDIIKIKAEAVAGGLEGWAMQIQFDGSATKKKFAVIDWEEFLELRKDSEAYRKHFHE